MARCHDMKKGEIYKCDHCGLELQVVNECRKAGTPSASCSCHESEEEAGLVCCSRRLEKK